MRIIIAMFIVALATASYADEFSHGEREWRQEEIDRKLDRINDQLQEQEFERQRDRMRSGSTAREVYIERDPYNCGVYSYNDMGFGEIDTKTDKVYQEILNRPVLKYVPPKKGKK